ncbi:DUF5133 domain-containing protein [Streptomyces sp. NPDC006798]|uniref:DUF5133 domain-containing protein n=1 Tax=Streptomyces sp. NPDC006798 TaxID=3155462 RepID=UPI003406D274
MVPKPDTDVVRELVDRYDTLTAEPAARADSSIRLEGIVYTLCVITGTRRESQALTAARGLLSTRGGSRGLPGEGGAAYFQP